MKYEILEALERLEEYEEMLGRKVPKPMYLFVQKYGRSMEQVLTETAEAYGKKKYFFFRKEKENKENALLDKFLVELQKRSELGKRFDGFVLVELTGEEGVKERATFYEYIKENAAEIACMLTVKNEEAAEVLRKELEQQFPFARTVHEECYSPAEQKEILMAAFRQGGAVLTEVAVERLEEILGKIEWNTTDHVENVLRNLANNLVYEQVMNGNAWEEISEKQVREALLCLEEKTEKIPIGFAAPPVSRENDKVCPEKGRKELVA